MSLHSVSKMLYSELFFSAERDLLLGPLESSGIDLSNKPKVDGVALLAAELQSFKNAILKNCISLEGEESPKSLRRSMAEMFFFFVEIVKKGSLCVWPQLFLCVKTGGKGQSLGLFFSA